MSNDETRNHDNSDESTQGPTGPGTNPADLPGSAETYVVHLGKTDRSSDDYTDADILPAGSIGYGIGEDPKAVARELRARWSQPSVPLAPPIDFVFIELDEDGPIDPLTAMIAMATLGIDPVELALLMVVATTPLPLPRMLPYTEAQAADDIERINRNMRPADRNDLRMGLTDDMIAGQNRSPFSELSDRRRQQRDERFQAMRGGVDWHPTPAGDQPINRRYRGFDLTDAVRLTMPYAPLFGAAITMGNTQATADAYGLTDADYARAADNRNMLTAWQAGTNRARAEEELIPYIEDSMSPESPNTQE